MSALLPIFMGNALFYKQVSHNDLPHFPEVVRNDAGPSKAKGNVYFFIFDEWSYLKSFPQKELIEPFVHLRQFQKQSIYFHKAFSYAPLTRFSMPALLFQAEHMLSINNNGIGFQQADTVVPLDQVEHIFTRARQQGYYTAMVGNYLPYREFLQDGVDFSFSKSHFKQFGVNFFDIVRQHLFNTFYGYVNEYKLPKIKTLRGYVLNRFFVRINDEIDAVTKKIITADAGPTFAMFHYVIPHPPFIYKRNGPTSFLKPADYTSPSGYHGNLEFLDEKIGELIDLCKRVGKYDQSLIILTSDHGWRFDGEAALEELCHVPLFIKFPYQDSPIEIHSPFSTVKLGMIVQDYLDGTLNISEAQAILKDPSFYVPPVSTGWDMEQLKSLFSLY
jgi:phosphoglycerol transferase MdoB-like AlkP superfamily enzyme